MWFCCDALGITLGLITWLLLAFADWVIVRYVIVGWFWTSNPRFPSLPLTDVGVCLCLVYQSLIGLSWFSHLQAAITDPGTIRTYEAPACVENPKLCKICQDCWKPPRAHHCKTCRRCIFRMDHHCPWVNNCVGYSNQKLFILFLFYIASSAAVTLALLSASAMYWLWTQSSMPDMAAPSSTSLICSSLVAVECLAAVLFVSDFMQEQIESITANSTLVETYQRTHGERTTFANHFKVIFGHRWWLWPVPISTCEAPNYLEPAIPDESEHYYYGNGSDESESLGIAGDESESAATRSSSQQGLRPRIRPDPDAALLE